MLKTRLPMTAANDARLRYGYLDGDRIKYGVLDHRRPTGILDAVFIASVLVLFVMVARSTRLQFGEPWMGAPFVLLAAACWKMRYIRAAHEVAGFVVAQVGVVAVGAAVWFIARVGLDGTHPDLIPWAVIPSFSLWVVSIIVLRRKWRARNSDN